MQAALEEEESEPLLIRGYRGERAFYHETMQDIRSGKFKVSQAWAGGPAQDLAAVAGLRSAHPWGLRHISRLTALQGLPLHEQLAQAAVIEGEIRKAPWVYQQMMGNSGGSVASNRRSQALMRCAIVAVAAERLSPQTWELAPVGTRTGALVPVGGPPRSQRRSAAALASSRRRHHALLDRCGRAGRWRKIRSQVSRCTGVGCGDASVGRGETSSKGGGPGKDPGPQVGP